MSKADYEHLTSQFRGQIEDLWNKRKVDQLRNQIDELRQNVDDLVKSYNRVMATGTDLLGETQRRLTRQAREGVEGVSENVMGEQGFSWWIPVAILGAIGAAAWLYNMFAAGAAEESRPRFTNYPAGSPSPMSSTETTFPEQR